MDRLTRLVEQQRAWFLAGHTLPVKERLAALERLRTAIVRHHVALESALQADLGRCNMESFLAETVLLLDSLDKAAAHVRRWAAPQRVRPSLFNLPSSDWLIPEPYGLTLILSPWNYPFLLSLGPLIAAISAGNCAVLKPSECAPAASALLATIIEDTFAPEHVALVQGGPDTATALLHQHFDYIFFTGSARVGRLVLQAAAHHLTPVTLELGGKSPCIVTESADLAVTARRIAWGKLFNAGQTCVAPDYVLVTPSKEEELLGRLADSMTALYGHAPRNNPDYARIINTRHHARLVSLLEPDKLFLGGNHDAAERYFSPTIMRGISWDAPAMREEIFGPILPVLTCPSLDEAINLVNTREKPLALYLFTHNNEDVERVWSRCHFGGGCVNDTLSQLLNDRLPFGGVGGSGMGCYHGQWGFATFSHYKSQVRRSTWADLPLRYPPYAGKSWVRGVLTRLFSCEPHQAE